MQKMKNTYLSSTFACVLSLFLGLNATALNGAHHASSSPEAALARLEIKLPTPSKSIANYVGASRSGNMIYLSGHIPRRADGSLVIGKLGDDLSVKDGYDAARLSAIGLIATLKGEVGELSKVKSVIKVFGMVNATDSFTDHSKVINGCSDLLVEVFGEKGRHARAACGFSSLPLGSAVEIEMIVEIEE
jgi:enamine deaminase RidA (YjgF/YER057c/UK114 family)